MAKYKNVHIDLFKRDITVFVGTHEEFIDWVSKCEVGKSWQGLKETIEESEEAEESDATYWYNPRNGNGIIELKTHPKTPEEIGTAAHEALHAVSHSLSFLGVPHYAHEANEPYTYFLELLLKEILDFDGYELINI